MSGFPFPGLGSHLHVDGLQGNLTSLRFVVPIELVPALLIGIPRDAFRIVSGGRCRRTDIILSRRTIKSLPARIDGTLGLNCHLKGQVFTAQNSAACLCQSLPELVFLVILFHQPHRVNGIAIQNLKLNLDWKIMRRFRVIFMTAIRSPAHPRTTALPTHLRFEAGFLCPAPSTPTCCSQVPRQSLGSPKATDPIFRVVSSLPLF